MPVPDFQSFILPVLRLAANGPVNTAETIAHVSDSFGLSAEDRQEMLASGRQTRVANRVYWTFVHLTKADLLRRESRGVYSITEEGRQALAENPQRIDLNFLMARSENYRAFPGQRAPSRNCLPVWGRRYSTPQRKTRPDAYHAKLARSLSQKT